MNIMLVDDERIALADLQRMVERACPGSRIECFQEAENAVAHVGQHQTEVAFLDIEMPGVDGLELAKRIKEAQPDTNIIFVTGYSQYAVAAFSLRASGYLLKPVSEESIRNELQNLRTGVVRQGSKGLFVHTFGNFEVFCSGEPVQFGRGKTKELFAYLVDRKGAGCTTAELCAVLWEDKEYNMSLQKQFQTIVSDLLRTLRKCGAQDIIVKRRNFLSVDNSKFDCDYYQFLDGDVTAINSYTGEYMTNYSWAEFTTGYLYWHRQA